MSGYGIDIANVWDLRTLYNLTSPNVYHETERYGLGMYTYISGLVTGCIKSKQKHYVSL